jgi:hypothetical protein
MLPQNSIKEADPKKGPLGEHPTAPYKLPFVNSFRTVCLASTLEMKAVFDGLQQLALAVRTDATVTPEAGRVAHVHRAIIAMQSTPLGHLPAVCQ